MYSLFRDAAEDPLVVCVLSCGQEVNSPMCPSLGMFWLKANWGCGGFLRCLSVCEARTETVDITFGLLAAISRTGHPMNGLTNSNPGAQKQRSAPASRLLLYNSYWRFQTSSLQLSDDSAESSTQSSSKSIELVSTLLCRPIANLLVALVLSSLLQIVLPRGSWVTHQVSQASPTEH
eukprot:2770782-Amphidinium_carterae.1